MVLIYITCFYFLKHLLCENVNVIILQSRMKADKAKEVYEKLLATPNIDPTLVCVTCMLRTHNNKPN